MQSIIYIILLRPLKDIILLSYRYFNKIRNTSEPANNNFLPLFVFFLWGDKKLTDSRGLKGYRGVVLLLANVAFLVHPSSPESASSAHALIHNNTSFLLLLILGQSLTRSCLSPYSPSYIIPLRCV